MKSFDIKKLKNTDRKQLAKAALRNYRSHNLAVLAVFAGILIGFSLLRVESLNTSAPDDSAAPDTSEGAEEFVPLILQKISLDEETVARLQVLAQDEDVEINSSLPGNRDNPFDDGTAAPPVEPVEDESEPSDTETQSQSPDNTDQ